MKTVSKGAVVNNIIEKLRLLVASGIILAAPLCAHSGAQVAEPGEPALYLAASGPAGSDQPKPQPSLTIAPLGGAVNAYRASANDLNWAYVVAVFKSALTDPVLGRAEDKALLKANPELTQLQAAAIDAGGARVWLFPDIAHSREAIVQWVETRTQPGSRRRPASAVTTSRVQSLALPPSIVVSEAKIVTAQVREAAPEPPEKRAKPAEPGAGKKASRSARFLVLAGSDRMRATIWLKCYRLGADGFREDSAPFALIPPFLLNNLAGKLAFSGSDLILTVSPQPATASSGGLKASVPEQVNSSYKLCLRLVEGRYALEGKPLEDTPYNAVYQFVQALAKGRIDLAKAWLVDPKLVSIPRYIGLASRAAPPSFRIINMPGPSQSTYRFRLVTFEMNDLIFDVTRAKTLWAVKAIFVAPRDPLMEKIARSLPAVDQGQAADGEGQAVRTSPAAAEKSASGTVRQR